MTCEHIFIFENEKENETCTGTHEVSKCLKCGKNLHRQLLDYLREHDYTKDVFNVPYEHDCVWDLSNAHCGNKLNFPDMDDESNYGFETKPYGLLEIPERRKCKKILSYEKHLEIKELLDNR